MTIQEHYGDHISRNFVSAADGRGTGYQVVTDSALSNTGMVIPGLRTAKHKVEPATRMNRLHKRRR